MHENLHIWLVPSLVAVELFLCSNSINILIPWDLCGWEASEFLPMMNCWWISIKRKTLLNRASTNSMRAHWCPIGEWFVSFEFYLCVFFFCSCWLGSLSIRNCRHNSNKNQILNSNSSLCVTDRSGGKENVNAKVDV